MLASEGPDLSPRLGAVPAMHTHKSLTRRANGSPQGRALAMHEVCRARI